MVTRFNVVKRYIRYLFDLKSTQESESDTLSEVKEGVDFKGKNLWLLAFAIIIACIGLNINSKSAVIGAMILSPVMGPVFGIGFSLGTSNSGLLKLSFKSALRIVVVSLFFSTLYYLLNPYALPTEELLSFSKPTIFDVFLAFIGGLAGMLAISRASGTQVIIGIAVATACIPPLCTAGFGFATLNLEYLIGGLYTYFINSLFICIGCYLMTRFLKFRLMEEKSVKNLSVWFSILTLITIAPALYLAFDLAKTNIYTSKANTFINKEIAGKYHLINTTVDAKKKQIEVDLVVNKYDEKLQTNLNQKVNNYQLGKTQLIVYQTVENKTDLQKEISQLKDEIEKLKKSLLKTNNPLN